MPVPLSGAFKALISVTDSSAPLSFFFLFPPPCLVGFLAAGGKTKGPCLWATAAVADTPSNGSTSGGGVHVEWWLGEAEARQLGALAQRPSTRRSHLERPKSLGTPFA